jgi:hypothetical protein
MMLSAARARYFMEPQMEQPVASGLKTEPFARLNYFMITCADPPELGGEAKDQMTRSSGFT